MALAFREEMERLLEESGGGNIWVSVGLGSQGDMEWAWGRGLKINCERD